MPNDSPTLELLGAGESALRARALAEVVSQADEFDREVYLADETPPVQWVAAAGTAPFMSDRRTVIVRNLRRLEPEDFVFPALPETARLVLVADEEGGDDNRQRKLDTNLTAWAKLVKAAGGTVTTFEVDAKQLRDRIRAEAQAMNKAMSPKAADLLAEMTGGSLSRALEEVEKLVLFVGADAEITENEVRSTVFASREWNVWKMLDSVVAGQVGEALSQLRTLLSGGAKAEEAAYRTIFPMLTRQLRMLWQARACLDARCEPKGAPASVSAAFPEQYNLAKANDFVVRNAMRSARGIDYGQLTVCFSALADADARLKGLLPSYSATETIERLVLEMVNAFGNKKAGAR